MKRFLIRLFSLALIFSMSGCKQEKEDVTYYISRTMILQQTGDINVREHAYDSHWNPISATITLNGNFSSKTEYSYSEDFTVVTQKFTSAIYEPDSTTIVRTFDEKGQVITAETYDGDRHISTAVNTYDNAGNVTFTVQTFPDSDLVTTIENTYDDGGNLITRQIDTGYYVTRIEYRYDPQNRCIREENYQNNELTAYCEYEWKGNTAQGANYSADGTPGFNIMLVRDDSGNTLVSEIRDVSGNLQTCTYNEYIGTDGSISSGIPK